jgi:hypothetical protein
MACLKPAIAVTLAFALSPNMQSSNYLFGRDTAIDAALSWRGFNKFVVRMARRYVTGNSEMRDTGCEVVHEACDRAVMPVAVERGFVAMLSALRIDSWKSIPLAP